MTTDEETLLARVRKLLAKAEGASTEQERDAYNTKAAELIGRYGIDEALVAAKDPEHHQPGDRVFDIDDPYAREKIQLIAAISIPLRVRVVQIKKPDSSPKRRRWQHQAHLFGMPADLERVEVLYTSLLLQMSQWGSVARPAEPTVTDLVAAAVAGPDALERLRQPVKGDQLAAYRRSWMSGFAVGIERRLFQMEQQAVERRIRDEQTYWHGAEDPTGREPSVELALFDQSKLVDARMVDAHPNLRQGRTRQLSDGRGLGDGAKAARRADLSTNHLGRISRGELT